MKIYNTKVSLTMQPSYCISIFLLFHLTFGLSEYKRKQIPLQEKSITKTDPRILGGSSSFDLSNTEISLGGLNTLIGSDSSSSTFSIQNGNYITLGVVVLIPLIIGLALLFYLVGGSGGGVTGTAGGYSALRRTTDYDDMTARNSHVSFSHNGIDWETFTILDWIAVAEETWKKFDPGNLDCQKRLICEVHQNTRQFGFFARKIVDAFSFLEYAEILRLPEELKAIINEYIDAADRGRTMKKECSDIYTNCNFSVKKMLDRFNHSNEI